jgi:GntR family histidine utilization transcriptional repressor
MLKCPVNMPGESGLEATPTPAAPMFARIKSWLIAEINRGRWKEGEQIPSEPELVKEFGVSRMTVNRAVRELTAEHILTRRQGAGTYVAPQKYQATLLEIKSIADEVRSRGHQYHSQLHQLTSVPADEVLCQQFAWPAAGRPALGHLFHSVIVHFDNQIPIQVEQRWVNPLLAPDYLQQDFTRITPNEYLMQVAPLQSAQYRIEALLPPKAIAAMLHIDSKQPTLVLHRQTHSGGQVASLATMWHPGERYQFEGQVGPGRASGEAN